MPAYDFTIDCLTMKSAFCTQGPCSVLLLPAVFLLNRMHFLILRSKYKKPDSLYLPPMGHGFQSPKMHFDENINCPKSRPISQNVNHQVENRKC